MDYLDEELNERLGGYMLQSSMRRRCFFITSCKSSGIFSGIHNKCGTLNIIMNDSKASPLRVAVFYSYLGVLMEIV